jgi:hypothetical protein
MSPVSPLGLFTIVRRKELQRWNLAFSAFGACQQFHAFNDNAFRVGRPFSSFIGPGIPDILAQKDLRRAASLGVLGLGAGGLRPGFPGLAALYEALPLAFKPPAGFFPSLRCHAGDLAIEHHHREDGRHRGMDISPEQQPLSRQDQVGR